MFGFAVWDTHERTLTLVRDHVGVKPLYYTKVRNEEVDFFLFASEIKALLATGLVRPAINLEALNQYLTFLWVPDPHTLFEGIHKLPPAHVLTVKDGLVTEREWWDVSFETIEVGRSEAWWQERVSETLERLVRMEMVADVPLMLMGLGIPKTRIRVEEW